MPWKTFKTTEDGKTRWCVHKLNADDSKGEKVACHDTEAEAEAQVKALYVNVKEYYGVGTAIGAVEDFVDVMVIHELRGDFPDIPFFADVDIAELTRGDDDPLYLTIPIAKANSISGNQRFYDEEWLQELERQVVEKRPIGIMGHLSEAELGTKFPDEAIFWLGVRRIGEMLWAKGYIPKGSAARDRIRRYKAANKTIGTSIFAAAEGVWNQARGALDMIAKSLKLHQIDIGPTDRIGIPSLAMVPHLTSEMDSTSPGLSLPNGSPQMNAKLVQPLPALSSPAPSGVRESGRDEGLTHQEPTMPEKNKLDYINEMSADDARLLPASVRDAILAQVPVAPEVAIVQELRQTLGADDKADLTQLVTELVTERRQQKEQEVTRRISELAADAEKGIKLLPVRKIVVEMVNAQLALSLSNGQPQSVADAEAIYTRVSQSDSIKELLQSSLQHTMGPPQRTLVQPQNSGAQYFRYPGKPEQDKES